MATGHVLPGFGTPISNMRRVRSAGYPLDKQALLQIANDTRLNQEEMEHIRSNARRLWSYPQKLETSYDNHYIERPADELMTLRPTSPTRRNKPHPTPVFLTNRLHHIPGYHNSSTMVGREAYRVDGSVPSQERDQRLSVRAKYQSNMDENMVSPYRDPFMCPHEKDALLQGLKEQLDGRSAQAAEAWLKIADDKDRSNVFHVVQKHRDQEIARDQKLDSSPRSKTAYPSLHRWMRYAGAKEVDSVRRIVQTLDSDPNRGYVEPNRPFHGRPVQSLLSVRKRDIVASANVRFQGKPSRGDFLMHPDWPPTIPHHRVP